jgi:hypothetical protein
VTEPVRCRRALASSPLLSLIVDPPIVILTR